MVVGSLLVGLCLFLLGWTTEFVGLFITDEGKVRFDNLSNDIAEWCTCPMTTSSILYLTQLEVYITNSRLATKRYSSRRRPEYIRR